MANSKRRHKSLKITQSAKGQECQVRYPGVCNFDDETTIYAHLGGGGMGTKRADIFGAYCCSSCHDLADSRIPVKVGGHCYTPEQIENYFNEGIFRTQQILLDKGLIKI